MGAAQADFRQSSSRIDRTQSTLLSSKNKLKLAVFGINVSNGCTMTPAEGAIQVVWVENKRIARAAEKIGIEGMQAMSDVGMDGLTLCWVDYDEDLAQFEEQILLLMVQAGLREEQE